MKNKIYFILALSYLIVFSACEKSNNDIHLPIFEDRIYTIEKIICNEKNRFFNWQCSINQNYIQKDISTALEKNFSFYFYSDNFNRNNFGFRVLIFVNNALRFRRSTRDFPFETTFVIPEGGIVSVKTYFEQYNNGNTIIESLGTVNCKVSCE